MVLCLISIPTAHNVFGQSNNGLAADGGTAIINGTTVVVNATTATDGEL